MPAARSAGFFGSMCGKLLEKGKVNHILAKDDLANLEGTVTEARGGGHFVHRPSKGHPLTHDVARALPPTAPTHGLILYRHKN